MNQTTKFFKYFLHEWKFILLLGFGIGLLLMLILFIYFGTNSFLELESFSKRNLMASMGIYIVIFLVVGIIQAFIGSYIYFYFMMGGGMSRMLADSSAEKTKTEVHWKDIIGMDDAKRDAQEIVQFIKDAKKVKAIGGTMIKGVMMIGPPGCGKTYLAKAIATECGLPFLSAVGSEFVGMFVGLGASRVKSLFKKARRLASIEGGCLIFIDEIDAFATPRVEDRGTGGGGISHNAAINQFLTELDGLRKRENNIVVIAATNVDPEKLDAAIMRSGRFDRKIYIEKPTALEREGIIQYYLSKIKTGPNIDIPLLAERAQWFSPADINNMVREASIAALRERRDTVTQDDLLKALDHLIVSIEKMAGPDKILSNRVNVKWDEVIGMENAKKEAWEVVELLKDRNRLKAVGGKIVKGVMMIGPPGCGKTYLAKAMATEAGFPFISRAGSEMVGTFIGVGAQKMKATFAEARKLAAAEGGCIIFFDEIDAFARPRMADWGGGGHIDHSATVNQFLTEMDGLRQAENNIVVLAATNVNENELDSAIMRAGRFDRKIYIALPNLKEREDLFKFYLSRVKTDETCQPGILARKALYFSPSQIDSMVREAGIFALRDKRDVLTYKDLSSAYDRIVYGDKSNITMTHKEKLWTAYHEAGHAIVAYLIHPSNDVIKATIIPRKGLLGMVAQRPVEELHSADKESLLADIKVMVAAYVAERLKFGMTSAGVGGGPGSDFYHAMQIAKAMVWSLGMGKSGLVGDFGAVRNNHGDYHISVKTHETLDSDVQEILQACIKDVEKILKEHTDVFEEFAQTLLNKEELEYDDIEAIFKKFGLKAAARPQLTPESSPAHDQSA